MAIRVGGRQSLTRWQCLEKFETNTSLLFLCLHSGRTHQIRVHLASIKCPILGDYTYGFRKELLPQLSIPRILLHAKRLEINHPITGSPLCIEAARPDDMENILIQLRNNLKPSTH
jgi:23S rRNA pseudouridine1911/1915/1917 synthase